MPQYAAYTFIWHILHFSYLSTGVSQQTIALSYRMGKSTVCKIISEITEAVYNVLQADYLKTPTKEKWSQIKEEFWKKWNFPNCCGALDDKHCEIQAPKQSGSDYFNYKKTFSIVLMALADANYCFTYIDIGAIGRQSDGGIFKNSTLYNGL